MRFLNLNALNNPREVDMSLKLMREKHTNAFPNIYMKIGNRKERKKERREFPSLLLD